MKGSTWGAVHKIAGTRTRRQPEKNTEERPTFAVTHDGVDALRVFLQQRIYLRTTSTAVGGSSRISDERKCLLGGKEQGKTLLYAWR